MRGSAHCRKVPAPQGFALVLVLWTMVLLTVIAGSFAFTMRSELTLARNLIDRAQADAISGGAIRVGLARLLTGVEEERFRVDGTIYQVTVGAHRARVAITSEYGKIDINRASDVIILSLMEYVVNEVGEGDPSALADNILDWRDRNDTRRLNGSEDSEYASEGRAYGSRDGPLLSVNELTQILGITPAVFEVMQPLVTVYSGRSNVDPATAPAAVLNALPGLDQAQVASFLEARASTDGSLAPASQLVSTDSRALAQASRVAAATTGIFTVIAEAKVGQSVSRQGATVRVRRVLRSPGRRRGNANRRSGRSPFSFVAWMKQLPTNVFGATSSEDAPGSAVAPRSRSDSPAGSGDGDGRRAG